jgi:ubiquinone/menaquinone biosynthesis C-methylase UbiE
MHQQKGHKGMGMNGPVAKWYASNTRKFMDEFQTLARRIAQIAPGAEVLEVAPGPGYCAIELAKLGGHHVTGLDISQTFVEIARKNAEDANVEADFRQGDVAHMPFAGDSFDFILCRAAFKNFSEPVDALREIERVLRPGGQALIIDMRKDAPETGIQETVDRMGGSWLNRVLNRFIFHSVLLKRAYTRRDFEGFLSQTHFRNIGIAASGIGFEISLTK